MRSTRPFRLRGSSCSRTRYPIRCTVVTSSARAVRSHHSRSSSATYSIVEPRHHRAFDHRRALRRRSSVEDRVVDIAFEHEGTVITWCWRQTPNDLGPAEHDRGATERRNHHREAIGRVEIVVVEERDEVTADGVESGVQRTGEPAVDLVANDTDARADRQGRSRGWCPRRRRRRTRSRRSPVRGGTRLASRSQRTTVVGGYDDGEGRAHNVIKASIERRGLPIAVRIGREWWA